MLQVTIIIDQKKQPKPVLTTKTKPLESLRKDANLNQSDALFLTNPAKEVVPRDDEKSVKIESCLVIENKKSIIYMKSEADN